MIIEAASQPVADRLIARIGAARCSAVLGEEVLRRIEACFGDMPAANVRFRELSSLQDLLHAQGQIGGLASRLMQKEARPVRAILLDKGDGLNWALGWHQDRTIAVVERAETDGFDRWTMKDGIIHVEPPIELLERMLTLRIHLDPVTDDNAPLLVAPGSHRLGRLTKPRIAAAVAQCGRMACHADRGDIWAYATPIVHASDRARPAQRRRVLQIDYSADILPEPLRWLTF